MLKKFKNMEGLRRSILKMELCKCLKKLPALKNSRLSSYYFKLIKTVWKSNKERFTNDFINHCCFYLFPWRQFL